MFYQVRILDRYGKVKKVVSMEELRKAHWDRFDENKKSYVMPKKNSIDVIENIEPLNVSVVRDSNEI